ncbi:MAG TPA: helix-turn-helix transcriptional regulator [Puia sp.]|nr:helix-turn-helix transcriptional regulator [Puia sp.]
MNFFPKNLRYLRKKKGQNQSELSKLVNKKQNTIGNWENAVSEPGIRELTILTQYFGVSLEDLVASDLETMDRLSGDKQSLPESGRSKRSSYPLNENANTLASEDGQNQFWVLVRELKRVHEKLDDIKGMVESKQVVNKSGSQD